MDSYKMDTNIWMPTNGQNMDASNCRGENDLAFLWCQSVGIYFWISFLALAPVCICLLPTNVFKQKWPERPGT